MKALDIVHLLAGTLVIAGVSLTVYVNPWWAILPGFVGANLFQFGITKFCPMIWMLKRLGVEE